MNSNVTNNPNPNVDKNQGINELPKTMPAQNPEKISRGDQTTAKIGGNVLSNADDSSTNVRTIQRERLPCSTDPEIHVDGLVKNVTENKNKKINVTLKDIIKAEADDKLLREKNISSGRKKLLTDMANNPALLQTDLERPGNKLTIGKVDRDSSYFEGHTIGTIYRYMSKNLKGYINEKNPNLRVSDNKINEILHSSTQAAANDLYKSRVEVINKFLPGWAPERGSSGKKMETSFKFERTLLLNPEVLIVSRKIVQEYKNLNDPNAKPKIVVMEARVKHNLKTGNVKYEYEMSIKDKGAWRSQYHKIWDPTKDNR